MLCIIRQYIKLNINVGLFRAKHFSIDTHKYVTIIFLKGLDNIAIRVNRSRPNAARKYLLRCNKKQMLVTNVWGC